ncbi:MAG: hypothetical protein IPL83_11070 [Bdellovibrionales bacterium]|nr:hypothetical protein [Bdellovibrionales bacterium]
MRVSLVKPVAYLSASHQYIENTIPSVEAAYKLGATIGHINLRKTADNKLAVFHEEDLSCRTDGSGNLSQSTMAYLKQLDVGYGYTPDKGISYPTRGLGKGMMPTFEEVLSAFPDRQLAINVKSEDETTAKLIEEILAKYPSLDRKTIFYIGGANESIQKVCQRHSIGRNERAALKMFWRDCKWLTN